MKLLFLALLFFILTVSTSASKFFKFEDIKNGSPEGKGKSYLQELEENVNQKLEELAAKDPKLELEVKRFLDFYLDCYLSSYRTNDIYDKLKLEIACETIKAFLKLKLAPFGLDKRFFMDINNMFFHYASYSSRGNPNETAIENFVKDTFQKNQDEFTKEEREILSNGQIYSRFYQYLIFQYVMSLDKDQYIKLFFRNGLPQSSEKPLCLSDEDFNLTLKEVSNYFLFMAKNFHFLDKKADELIEVSILPKLYKLALPEIKTFKWLNGTPVPSEPNPSDNSKPNNSNKGLFDGKEKIFAVCAIVLIIAVLVCGFAFWHLRLRKKALIAPISG
jgi:hypothetical protein